MLVLSRQVGQEIVIGDRVSIRVTAVQGKRVRLAIEAPEDVGVRRKELPAKEELPATPTASE